MHRLIEGVHRFRAEDFGQYQSLFHRLSQEKQRPHTLFITCSDSRVLAELITKSAPGDLFVVKNPGNIVPPSSVAIGPNSTAAAVEFAVAGLDVSDIVVCGHTQCGAMDALLTGLAAPHQTPHLAGWLELAASVRNLLNGPYANLVPAEGRAIVAAEENVLLAIENLRTYGVVRERIEQGRLRLHAWMFKIANAELFAYEADRQEFRPIVPRT